MAGTVRTSVGQNHRTLHAATKYMSVIVQRLYSQNLVQVSLSVLFPLN